MSLYSVARVDYGAEGSAVVPSMWEPFSRPLPPPMGALEDVDVEVTFPEKTLVTTIFVVGIVALGLGLLVGLAVGKRSKDKMRSNRRRRRRRRESGT